MLKRIFITSESFILYNLKKQCLKFQFFGLLTCMKRIYNCINCEGFRRCILWNCIYVVIQGLALHLPDSNIWRSIIIYLRESFKVIYSIYETFSYFYPNRKYITFNEDISVIFISFLFHPVIFISFYILFISFFFYLIFCDNFPWYHCV